MGKDAHTFLSVRTALENKLTALKFDHFYGGIISKYMVYENHLDMLGQHFPQNFVELLFGEDDRALAVESISTLYHCLEETPLEDYYFRITDKHINTYLKRYLPNIILKIR